MKRGFIAAALIGAPLTTQAASFKEIVNGPILTIGNSVIALLYALAFALFLFGVLRFFLAAQNEEARMRGKQFMLWGIIALVVLFTVWGIVRILLGVLTSWA